MKKIWKLLTNSETGLGLANLMMIIMIIPMIIWGIYLLVDLVKDNLVKIRDWFNRTKEKCTDIKYRNYSKLNIDQEDK